MSWTRCVPSATGVAFVQWTLVAGGGRGRMRSEISYVPSASGDESLTANKSGSAVDVVLTRRTGSIRLTVILGAQSIAKPDRTPQPAVVQVTSGGHCTLPVGVTVSERSAPAASDA